MVADNCLYFYVIHLDITSTVLHFYCTLICMLFHYNIFVILISLTMSAAQTSVSGYEEDHFYEPLTGQDVMLGTGGLMASGLDLPTDITEKSMFLSNNNSGADTRDNETIQTPWGRVSCDSKVAQSSVSRGSSLSAQASGNGMHPHQHMEWERERMAHERHMAELQLERAFDCGTGTFKSQYS